MRIRTIKPEFFKHEELFEAEKQSKLPIRLAFVGLWCAADREGRFKWRPRQLGTDILPYDEVDFSRVLDALLTRGFVVKYEANGEWFGCIPSFLRHQVINNRESASKLPEVTEPQGLSDASGTREPRVNHASPDSERGREGKGREGKGREASASPPLPACLETDGFKAAWMEWNQHRKEKRKPITPLAASKQLAALADMGVVRAVAAITHSIANGWTGIFEPKFDSSKTSTASGRTTEQVLADYNLLNKMGD